MAKYLKQPSLFAEVKEIRRFFKIPAKERGIVFYAEHAGYWPTFEGLIKELQAAQKPLIYITSDWRDRILTADMPLITSVYSCKLLPLLMQLIDSRIVIMTLSDLNNHSIKRSRYPLHYVYVFHALVSTHMMYSFGAFDHYDSVLCTGPHQIKELRKQEEMYHLQRKNLIEAGYYRLERIMNAYTNHKEKNQPEKKTVLIAPSWGNQNVLETCGHAIVRILLAAGYNVIVRPHSETIKRSPDLIQKINEEFFEHPGFLLERSNENDHSMIVADVLISDCSGITLEYAFGTERPVIFIDVPLKIKNARYQELGIEPLEVALRSKIGKIVSPHNLESLPKVVRELIDSTEAYGGSIRQLRNEWVFHIGNSSKIGANYISKL